MRGWARVHEVAMKWLIISGFLFLWNSFRAQLPPRSKSDVSVKDLKMFNLFLWVQQLMNFSCFVLLFQIYRWQACDCSDQRTREISVRVSHSNRRDSCTALFCSSASFYLKSIYFSEVKPPWPPRSAAPAIGHGQCTGPTRLISQLRWWGWPSQVTK